MKKGRLIMVCFCLVAFLFSGCASLKSIPEVMKAGNPVFDASLSTKDFMVFTLTVQNKTDKNIELFWNKTFYIDPSGGTNNFFTFGTEIHYEEKDTLTPPTIIFPHTAITRNLYPLANRYWKKEWKWKIFTLGKNGIYLTILVEGKEITEKIILEIVKTD